jgi:hypothetical protein
LADDTTDEIITKLTRIDLLIIDHFNYIRTKVSYANILVTYQNLHINRQFALSGGGSLKYNKIKLLDSS